MNIIKWELCSAVRSVVRDSFAVMPVGTNPRNGNNCPRDAKTNGDEESSNSDDGSSMCESGG